VKKTTYVMILKLITGIIILIQIQENLYIRVRSCTTCRDWDILWRSPAQLVV